MRLSGTKRPSDGRGSSSTDGVLTEKRSRTSVSSYATGASRAGPTVAATGHASEDAASAGPSKRVTRSVLTGMAQGRPLLGSNASVLSHRLLGNSSALPMKPALLAPASRPASAPGPQAKIPQFGPSSSVGASLTGTGKARISAPVPSIGHGLARRAAAAVASASSGSIVNRSTVAVDINSNSTFISKSTSGRAEAVVRKPAKPAVGRAAAILSDESSSGSSAIVSPPAGPSFAPATSLAPSSSAASSCGHAAAPALDWAETYERDILTHQLALEKLHSPPHGFMSGQANINPRMRAILFDWMIDVGQRYRQSHETVFRSLYLLDAYLVRRSHVERRRLQLVGACALLVASKFEEASGREVTAGMMVHMCAGAYGHGQVIEGERDLLDALGFFVHAPTPYTFLPRSLRAFLPEAVGEGFDPKTGCPAFSYACFVLELASLEYESTRFPPSLLAAAAAAVATFAQRGSLTGLPGNAGLASIVEALQLDSLCKFEEAVNFLQATMQSPPSESVNVASAPLATVRRKYSSHRFHEAGKQAYVPMDVTTVFGEAIGLMLQPPAASTGSSSGGAVAAASSQLLSPLLHAHAPGFGADCSPATVQQVSPLPASSAGSASAGALDSSASTLDASISSLGSEGATGAYTYGSAALAHVDWSSDLAACYDVS